MRLLQTLLMLGGRPMTAGHNDDVGEPLFPPVPCRRDGSRGMRRGAGRARGRFAAPAGPMPRRAC
ncbi:MAG TPA: hypothetical protein VM619_11560 [Luteimonas sp.]|nr:hypothetical protein [Luteimonas sp.]